MFRTQKPEPVSTPRNNSPPDCASFREIGFPSASNSKEKAPHFSTIPLASMADESAGSNSHARRMSATDQQRNGRANDILPTLQGGCPRIEPAPVPTACKRNSSQSRGATLHSWPCRSPDAIIELDGPHPGGIESTKFGAQDKGRPRGFLRRQGDAGVQVDAVGEDWLINGVAGVIGHFNFAARAVAA